MKYFRIGTDLAQCFFSAEDGKGYELLALNGNHWDSLTELVAVLARVFSSGERIMEDLYVFEDSDEDGPFEFYWQLDRELFNECLLHADKAASYMPSLERFSVSRCEDTGVQVKVYEVSTTPSTWPMTVETKRWFIPDQATLGA